MEVKQLSTKHLYILAKALGRMGKTGIKEFMQQIQEAKGQELDEDEKNKMLGLSLLPVALEHAEDLTKELLADLGGFKSVQEFDDSSFETPLNIVETIIERDGEAFKNFISSAQKLAKNFGK
jgi:hypothetical protein